MGRRRAALEWRQAATARPRHLAGKYRGVKLLYAKSELCTENERKLHGKR